MVERKMMSRDGRFIVVTIVLCCVWSVVSISLCQLGCKDAQLLASQLYAVECIYPPAKATDVVS